MESPETASGQGQLRRSAAAHRWWGGLTEFERAFARRAAWTEDELPVALFLGLVDTGVLTVSDRYRQTVVEGEPSFAMPKDVRAFVLAQGLPPDSASRVKSEKTTAR